MPTLELTDQEIQAVIAVLQKAPWDLANPILYKIARQMPPPAEAPVIRMKPDGRDDAAAPRPRA